MQRTAVTPEELVETLARFAATVMRASQGEVFRVVDELDLTMTQLKLLFILDGSQGRLTPSELARAIGLSPAATGRAVDELARKGIVSRREDEHDRRVKRLALTDPGQAVADRIAQTRREGFARIVEPLDPAQRDALAAALAPLLPTSPDCDAEAPR